MLPIQARSRLRGVGVSARLRSALTLTARLWILCWPIGPAPLTQRTGFGLVVRSASAAGHAAYPLRDTLRVAGVRCVSAAGSRGALRFRCG